MEEKTKQKWHFTGKADERQRERERECVCVCVCRLAIASSQNIWNVFCCPLLMDPNENIYIQCVRVCVCVCVCVRERGSERIDRERGGQTNKQTDREMDRLRSSL